MPFRLSNTPVAFQRFINEVLRDLMDICMVGYLDDILIYSDSLEDHQDHVCEVLHHLHMVGLYANLKKCKFHTDTVEYLRFILSPKGLQMDPTKVSMIQDWPEPHKVRDVQPFLCFANFCQRFIHDYSQTTLPLNDLSDAYNILENYTPTKNLSRHQARWSSPITEFNLRIRFRCGGLATKPDALMTKQDVSSQSVATVCNRPAFPTPRHRQRRQLAT